MGLSIIKWFLKEASYGSSHRGTLGLANDIVNIQDLPFAARQIKLGWNLRKMYYDDSEDASKHFGHARLDFIVLICGCTSLTVSRSVISRGYRGSQQQKFCNSPNLKIPRRKDYLHTYFRKRKGWRRPRYFRFTNIFPLDSMSTQGASLLSSSSSSSRRWIYDVFLSFRGEDTRNSFTDHLYAALQRSGISTFRDNEKLERGKSIAPELLKAIEESRFAIVILSRNYASSTWCLDELAKIIQCMKEMEMTVLPIFYKVDPSDGNTEKVQTWRAALSEVANLSGCHSQDRPEAEVIDNIVKDIDNVLTNNTGTEAIEGIVLTFQGKKGAHWNRESFSKMHRLKLLIIEDYHLINIEQLWTDIKSWEMLKKLTVLNLEVIKKSAQGLFPKNQCLKDISYVMAFPGSEIPEWFSHQYAHNLALSNSALFYLLPQLCEEEDRKSLWECNANGFHEIGIIIEGDSSLVKKCGLRVYKECGEKLSNWQEFKW
ncbi:hypothetical protein CMV_024649 [Castanea mollissima]|uniref:ADP-ribosyl cyclase/cyclic ADP-ribose hydrolase n=1 Tax=Castanea mollissima TaxID=60419 RepID=A0A8J4V9E8_9ROSI|nr:hypothetical protein CMV_024649 [Castanea mollissima]